MTPCAASEISHYDEWLSETIRTCINRSSFSERRIAHYLGCRRQLLALRLDPKEEDHRFPASHVRVLRRLLLPELDRSLVDYERTKAEKRKPEPFPVSLAQVTREVTEVVVTGTQAIADGRLTRGERADARTEAQQAIRALQAYVDALDAMDAAEPYVVAGLKTV